MFCVFSVCCLYFILSLLPWLQIKKGSQIRSILYKLDRDHFQKKPHSMAEISFLWKPETYRGFLWNRHKTLLTSLIKAMFEVLLYKSATWLTRTHTHDTTRTASLSVQHRLTLCFHGSMSNAAQKALRRSIVNMNVLCFTGKGRRHQAWAHWGAEFCI